MRVIEILNKISNGEEVPNFIVDEVEYYMGANGYLRECMGDDVEWFIDKSWLNTEARILEEPKGIPEKLDDRILLYRRIEDLGIPLKDMLDKINEILDYLESKGE